MSQHRQPGGNGEAAGEADHHVGDHQDGPQGGGHPCSPRWSSRCCPGRWRCCPTPGTCSDVGAIAGALWAIHLAARPAGGAWTFGWKRAEIISAAGNGITLLVVSAVVAFEAIRRLIDPPPVDGGPVLVVALIGVAVNVAAAWVLAKANRSSLNIEGAYQHILTDLYGFIGTVIAGIVILTTG